MMHPLGNTSLGNGATCFGNDASPHVLQYFSHQFQVFFCHPVFYLGISRVARAMAEPKLRNRQCGYSLRDNVNQQISESETSAVNHKPQR